MQWSKIPWRILHDHQTFRCAALRLVYSRLNKFLLLTLTYSLREVGLHAWVPMLLSYVHCSTCVSFLPPHAWQGISRYWQSAVVYRLSAVCRLSITFVMWRTVRNRPWLLYWTLILARPSWFWLRRRHRGQKMAAIQTGSGNNRCRTTLAMSSVAYLSRHGRKYVGGRWNRVAISFRSEVISTRVCHFEFRQSPSSAFMFDVRTVKGNDIAPWPDAMYTAAKNSATWKSSNCEHFSRFHMPVSIPFPVTWYEIKKWHQLGYMENCII